jgi:riboflavin transporter FmnP
MAKTSRALNSRELTLCAALAAVSAITQIIHFGYQSAQFGMWIDFVACSWFIAFFLFGIRGVFVTSIISALFITLFSSASWLGALMKWSTTFPIWLSLSCFTYFSRKKPYIYANPIYLIIPLVIGLLVRCLIALPLNYYFAIPIWTGLEPNKAMQLIPWYIVSGFNFLQGIIDIVIAWIITFRFKIIKFSSWEMSDEFSE